MTCRTCKLWDRAAAMDKAGRIHRDSVARCLWQSVEIVPHSVSQGYAYNRVRPMYMCADDGEGCPCHTPLDT